MNGVCIRFEDTSAGGYTFRPITQFDDLWPVVPRVGEYLFDANEFRYVIKEVRWWSSRDVSILLERA